MPISPSQLRRLLEQKREAFTDFNQVAYERLQTYRKAWRQFSGQPLSEQEVALKTVPVPRGAYPLEAVETRAGVVSCQLNWRHREESLDWVRETLAGVTTFAVDGSQIFPSKDLSLPIALVQVGWFENPHSPTGTYQKDVRLEVMTPKDLSPRSQAQPVDRRVNIRRFEMEIERLVEYMEACQQPDRTLVMFDGSLVATFAEAFDSESREAYVSALLDLLKASEAHRVPLVGYVDTTYARDLTMLLQQAMQLPPTESIHDAQLVNPGMAWGDRTPLFCCDRGGILDLYGEQGECITFTYLKTTREGFPARLEMPLWLWESGIAQTVIDWVRAEVVIGSGYPYAIETADKTAVLQAQDRQVFYRILQDWADQADIDLRFSRKMVSKVRRR